MLLRYCRSFWNSIASVNDDNRLMKQVTRPKSERNKEHSVTSFRAFPYMSVKVSSHYVIARDRKQRVCGQRSGHLASFPHFLARRVWNGIFAARDGRAKRDLKTMSLRRDRISETTTREKWPQSGLSASELSVAGFGGPGGRARTCDPLI